MDAPRGPFELTQSEELDRLRRRAYGPGADIAGDTDAQARLSDLEAAQSRPLTPDFAAAARFAAPEHVRVSKPVDEPTNSRELDPTTRTFLSTDRGRAVGIVAFVVALGALRVAAIAIGALVVNQASEPRPVAQLAAQLGTAQGAVPIDEESAREWDVTNATFVSHGSYGAAEIWTTTTPGAKQCLAVVVGAETWRFNCTAPTIDTIADIDIDSNMVPPAPSGEPTWNIRFVLHDGVVDVYLAPNPDGGYF